MQLNILFWNSAQQNIPLKINLRKANVNKVSISNIDVILKVVKK